MVTCSVHFAPKGQSGQLHYAIDYLQMITYSTNMQRSCCFLHAILFLDAVNKLKVGLGLFQIFQLLDLRK